MPSLDGLTSYLLSLLFYMITIANIRVCMRVFVIYLPRIAADLLYRNTVQLIPTLRACLCFFAFFPTVPPPRLRFSLRGGNSRDASRDSVILD